MEELTLQIDQPEEGNFLKKIVWNKQEIMDAVKTITERYEGLVYTEEQMKEAKSDRAALNGMRKAISDRRIEVKKTLLAPYDIFESEVREVVALIDKPIAMIDEQTSAYEDRIREEKKEELAGFFNENVGELKDSVTFDMIFNPKWLNKTVTMKACISDILSALDRIRENFKIIENVVDEKYKPYAKDFYFRTGMDINKALDVVGRMRDADRKAEEERLARAEAEERRREQESLAASMNPPVDEEESETDEPESEREEDTNNNAEVKNDSQDTAQPGDEHAVDPFADKDTDTKIYKASFTIRGTKAQILSVRKFMIRNNITFGKAEK